MINYITPVNLIPDNDEIRLQRLDHFEILGTFPEADFDAIVMLAAKIFETGHACITFVDKDEIFVKASSNGLYPKNIPRENSLSAVSILREGVTVYRDTHQFHELLDSPFLSANKELRFYAAAPIITADGFPIGTIVITDDQPHLQVDQRQLSMLQLLAGMVMERMETRLINRKMSADYDKRLRRLVHDMKNPVTSISLYAQLLSTREISADKVSTMAAKIEKSTKTIENSLNGLLTDN